MAGRDKIQVFGGRPLRYDDEWLNPFKEKQTDLIRVKIFQI